MNGVQVRRAQVVILAACLLSASSGSVLGQSPVPDATAQRVERASAGFAVSLPIGWEHQDAATYDEDWWDSDYGAPRRQHKRFITHGGKLRARTSRSFLTSHEQCYLYDWTDHAAEPHAWDSLDDAYAYYDSASDDSDAIWTFAAYLDLPVGRAVHRDALHDSGWYWRDYLFTNDTTWFMLVCGAEDPPEDRWLSIAETFEFLPEEE